MKLTFKWIKVKGEDDVLWEYSLTHDKSGFCIAIIAHLRKAYSGDINFHAIISQGTGVGEVGKFMTLSEAKKAVELALLGGK